MQRPQPNAATPRTQAHRFLDERQFYSLYTHDSCLHSVLYRVIPAGRNFFHIVEVPSGRIKGFRSGHRQACELARQLEAILQKPHG